MTQNQIIQVRDEAQAAGDNRTYVTAWVALGFHRHPAFLPATAAEQTAAVAELQASNLRLRGV